MFLKSLKFWLASFLMMRILGDEGGGGDFFIDDEEEDSGRQEKKADGKETSASSGRTDEKEDSGRQEKKADGKEELDARLSDLESFKKEADIKQAIDVAVEGIKEEHPNFDIEKVASYLKKIHEKDPQKAEAYNSPAGWEAIWLKHFASNDAEGGFDPGRKNAEEPFDFEKVTKKALSGDKRAMKALFENSK